ARQLPAAVEQRATAGVGQGAAERLVLHEQVVGARARVTVGFRLGSGRGLKRLARLRGRQVGLLGAFGGALGQPVVAGQTRGRGLDRSATGQGRLDATLLRGGRDRGRRQRQQHGDAETGDAHRGSDPGSNRSLPASAAWRAWASCWSMSRLTEVSAPAECAGSCSAAVPAPISSRAMRTWYTMRGCSIPARAKVALTRRIASLRTLPRSLWRWSTQPKNCSTVPVGANSRTL